MICCQKIKTYPAEEFHKQKGRIFIDFPLLLQNSSSLLILYLGIPYYLGGGFQGMYWAAVGKGRQGISTPLTEIPSVIGNPYHEVILYRLL